MGARENIPSLLSGKSLNSKFVGGGGYLKNIEAPDLRPESLSGVGDLDALVAPTPGWDVIYAKKSRSYFINKPKFKKIRNSTE